MERSLLWIMMDSRLRGNDREEIGNDREEIGNDREEIGNDREEIGNDMRIRKLHREIRNYIRILLKEFM